MSNALKQPRSQAGRLRHLNDQFPSTFVFVGEGEVDRNRHVVYERRVISINMVGLSFIHGRSMGWLVV